MPRSKLDFDQVQSAVRQGTGPKFQMSAGGVVVNGHAAVFDGGGNIVDSGAPGTPYVLPPATASVLGGVKIGANVTVAADGTISVAAQVQTDWNATSGLAQILNKPPFTWDGTTITAPAPLTVTQGITVQTASQSLVIGDRGDGDIGFNCSNSVITIGNKNMTSASSVYIASAVGGILVINDYGVTGTSFTINVTPYPAYAAITCNPGVSFQTQLQLAYGYNFEYLANSASDIYKMYVGSASSLHIDVTSDGGSSWASALSIDPTGTVNFNYAQFNGEVACASLSFLNNGGTLWLPSGTNTWFVLNNSQGSCNFGIATGLRPSGGYEGYVYSSTGYWNIQASCYITGQCQATAFNVHGSGSTYTDVVQSFCRAKKPDSDEPTVLPDHWGLIADDAGIHVLYKKDNDTVADYLIKWNQCDFIPVTKTGQ